MDLKNVFPLLLYDILQRRTSLYSKTDPTKLMVGVSYQFPVTFPFSYADVSYNDMKIPKRFKHLIRQLSNNNLFSSIKIKIESNSHNLFISSSSVRDDPSFT